MVLHLLKPTIAYHVSTPNIIVANPNWPGNLEQVVKPLLVTLSVFVALVSRPTLAASCDSATTQADMNVCASNANQKSDKQLNDLYRQIVGLLAGDRAALELFNSAQRAWTVFRDSECKFVGSAYEGGSIQGMVVSNCLRTLTDLRVEDFRRFVACEEGGNDCYAEFVPPN